MLLDAKQLLAPVALEPAGPFMQRPDCFGVGAIEDAAPFATHVDQADLAQHLQMFGNRWLPEAERRDHVADRTFLGRKVVEDFASPGFGYRVERIRRRGGARHTAFLFRYGNMSSSLALCRNSHPSCPIPVAYG
jgi:hypothetical protein